MSSSKVRVRFAPSPTGYLHVGGARTAFFNYLFAKNKGGDFVLRIEDTDQARSTEESLKMVLDDLIWLGLRWDEGPVQGGAFGPYRQSERLDIYAKVAQELLQKGMAYYCFLTDAELETQREAARAAGRQPHVQSPYENLPLEKALEMKAQGKAGAVRFKTRQLKKDYVLNDLIRNQVSFPSDMVGDFVLLRSDGMPVYNFCCVVDDHLMGITHILRAEEHLSNTLRQMMIYEGMGWPLPQFGHLSLILDEDRQKLSKRKGATSCHEFSQEGFLPEALLNFIALLGWSHPEEKEVLTLEEMIHAFDLNRVNPAGAVFDIKKLRWMNSMHLRALPETDLWRRVLPFLEKEGFELPADSEWQTQSLNVFKSRMETLVDAVELYRPVSQKHFSVSPESAETLSWESSKAALMAWHKGLSELSSDYLTEEGFVQLENQVKEQAQVKGKHLFMPIRVAVIGKPHGAELKILVPLISRKNLLKRVEMVLETLR